MLRGGGGNFGIVTSFEYRLHPVAEILGGTVVHPLDQAEAYLAFLTDPQAGVPVVAMLLGYNGPLDEGENVLAPARHFGRPVAVWWARCRMPCARPCWMIPLA
jgi:hypothetical protein